MKKLIYTFAYIAVAYESGPYAKQSEAYKGTYGGKDETPESKLALANIHQLVDRMIDGYARAIALAGTDPQFEKQKALWMESLTTWYKFRNPADTEAAGLKDVIAGVLSKPLPPEPTPIVSLPPTTPATPAATPAANTNGNGAGTNPGTTPANPAGSTTTKPATPTTPAGTTPKPASTKPDRPRNR